MPRRKQHHSRAIHLTPCWTRRKLKWWWYQNPTLRRHHFRMSCLWQTRRWMLWRILRQRWLWIRVRHPVRRMDPVRHLMLRQKDWTLWELYHLKESWKLCGGSYNTSGVHILKSDNEEGRHVPWCRDAPFVQDPTKTGEGLITMRRSSVCQRCLGRMPRALYVSMAEQCGWLH